MSDTEKKNIEKSPHGRFLKWFCRSPSKGKTYPSATTTSALQKTQSLADASADFPPANPLHAGLRSSEPGNAIQRTSRAAKKANKLARDRVIAEQMADTIIKLLLPESEKKKKALLKSVENGSDVVSKSCKKFKNELELKAFLHVVGATLKEDSVLARVDRPVTVVGDIHGQLFDLIYIFSKHGIPPERKYLFIGDYTDRGLHSTECLFLLYALKLKFPQMMFLLRGNHEDEEQNNKYGFKEESTTSVVYW